MTDLKSRVSAIIPTYNYGRYLSRAIESVLVQQYPIEEIIVVDDGSTDNTRAVVESFGERIRYIHQSNQGISAARNNGIGIAKGDWIAFLDADDWWMPEKIRLQMEVAVREPEAALIYTGAWRITPDGSRELLAATAVRQLWPTLRYCNCVSGGSSAIVRRDALVAEGGFDENLRACEDWDMWIRLARKYKFAMVPAPVTAIAVWPQSVSSHPENMLSNMEKMLDKTILSDLTGLRRSLWRRRIWSAQLFSAAIAARGCGPSEERGFLLQSISQWPMPGFLPKRWPALVLNIAHSVRRDASELKKVQ
jgi:cellulose synthase/poly-beta-1,6-N-acetylglucosamine synthase-like glycosyltransferase